MKGLIDTVRFKVEAVLSPRDAADLRSRGFRYMRNVTVLDEGSGESYIMKEMFHDERTGLRVMSDENSTKVEASIPRVLGLDNVLQESVTESDAFNAFEVMTGGLLPFTSENKQWGITRLDLARNFKADVPYVVGAYSSLTHPEIRKPAKIMFGESVSYFGSNREVVIYDKGAEMGEISGQLGRAECRWMGMKGLDKFVCCSEWGMSFQKPDQFSIPYFLKQKDGDFSYRKVVYLHADNKQLNDIMQKDISRLGTPKPVEKYKDLIEIAMHALMTHPEEYPNFFKCMDKQKAYRYKKKLKAYIQRYAEVDLVQLIWKEAA